MALPDPDPADVETTASVGMVVSAHSVSAGETLSYTLTVGCDGAAGCRDAVLTDVLHAPLQVSGAVVSAGPTADVVVQGNDIAVYWKVDLGDGTVGLPAGEVAEVSVTAVVPADLSTDQVGQPVDNTAVLEGANFLDVGASATVTPAAPPAPPSMSEEPQPTTEPATPESIPAKEPETEVSASADKSIDPDVVAAGNSTTVTITAANTSAAPIDRLWIREPATGSFPDVFTFDGFSRGIDFPEGATSGMVAYTLTDGETESVPFDDGVTPADPSAEVASFEVIFQGPIATGAIATLAYAITTDADLPVSALPVRHHNRVAVHVENRDAQSEATAEAIASVIPRAEPVTPPAPPATAPAAPRDPVGVPQEGPGIGSTGPVVAETGPTTSPRAAVGWIGMGVFLTLATVIGALGIGARRRPRRRYH
ncbi:hypothetical protein [Tessaracoccus palaemonis]|uniref:DUF11 domain-containing protein n=1 Tax=Tessaracoccus palaemonis TaxID=2829499 RepID=A0ABX8SHA5_9ACTN|nr:hypothetical protein [Tessaracoccus palaemonis]QXT62787.1 DUF11 domain-containing protein [Tessaracoccus palaemonis]